MLLKLVDISSFNNYKLNDILNYLILFILIIFIKIFEFKNKIVFLLLL